MRLILWDGWIIDYNDALAYPRREKKWSEIKCREIKFLVDIGAFRTIMPKKTLGNITPLNISEVYA